MNANFAKDVTYKYLREEIDKRLKHLLYLMGSHGFPKNIPRSQYMECHCYRQQKRLKPFEFKPFRTPRYIVEVDFGGREGIN